MTDMMTNHDVAEQIARDDLARAVKGGKKQKVTQTPMQAVRAIKEGHQAARYRGVFVDATTAHAICQVYDAVNEANKAKLDAMDIRKLATTCWKVISRSASKSRM